ncbi:hypothetical protein RJ639_003527 [Escallonia herrerae]|uniref:MMS19 nucleotide excision repair protein n=1 Tax=Escallonia herrerae TaxID=1293975 RepID=A0AA89AX91_9ASTE|nr:hypothetical protein RJ639_003527 [Escallonia herrerae]
MADSTQCVEHIESFVDSSTSPAQQAASVDAIASFVKNDTLTLESLVREMEMYLTTTDNIIRARGILLLAEVLTCLASKPLDNVTISSLVGFFTERLLWVASDGGHGDGEIGGYGGGPSGIGGGTLGSRFGWRRWPWVSGLMAMGVSIGGCGWPWMVGRGDGESGGCGGGQSGSGCGMSGTGFSWTQWPWVSGLVVVGVPIGLVELKTELQYGHELAELCECLGGADWKALRGALVGCLALVRRKGNYGTVTDSEARAIAESSLQTLSVQALGQHDRKLCFELLGCLLERYSDAVMALDDLLVYGVCEAIDGEKDPECLILTFHIVEVLAGLFPDTDGPLTSFAEGLFEILGSYFPIHFTHSKGEDVGARREELSKSLMLAFASTPLFEQWAIPLFLEKLSSSLPTAKVESLKYLSYCTVKYGAERMAKHVGALWSCLKDAIFTSAFALDAESRNSMEFQVNEIATEAFLLLRKVILQDDGSFLSLILGDDDINTVMNSLASFKDYDDIPIQSKERLHAVGCILSVSAKASRASCNRVFERFFPSLMDALGVSVQISSGGSRRDEDHAISSKLNFGAFYVSVNLLAACRELAVGFDEVSPIATFANETWCLMLHSFSSSLTRLFNRTLVTRMHESTWVAYVPSADRVAAVQLWKSKLRLEGSPVVLGIWFVESYELELEKFLGQLLFVLINLRYNFFFLSWTDFPLFFAVKGLQILATFPGNFLVVPKSVFEDVLMQLISIITLGFDKTFLWKMALKALVDIGLFLDKCRDSEMMKSFNIIVVERIVSLMSSDDFTMPSPLKVEAISNIGQTSLTYMLRTVEEFEKTISANLSGLYVHGNLKSAEITVQLLEWYSYKVLPWYGVILRRFFLLIVPSCYFSLYQSAGGFEEVPLRFSVSVWDQIENSTYSSNKFQEKVSVLRFSCVVFLLTPSSIFCWNLETSDVHLCIIELASAFLVYWENDCVIKCLQKLLSAMMMAMKHAVGSCLADGQSIIVDKALSIVLSSTFFPMKDSIYSTPLVGLKELQLTLDLDSFSSRDEWVVSLFASVIIALRPQTRISNIKVVVQLFMTTLLNGHVPSAQALGSIVNKLPSDGTDASKDFSLEEVTNLIFSSGVCSSCSNGHLTISSHTNDGTETSVTHLRGDCIKTRALQIHAVVGLAWIGKGLLMRGHEKVKDVIMTFLNCLLPGGNDGALPSKQDPSKDTEEQEVLRLMKSAADAFQILISDSEACLNRRFHATIRPLYKQRFFNIVMPMLLSSIVKSDASNTRSMLYRALAHVMIDTPLSAIVSEAKKLIPVLLDCLSMLSEDVLDKDILYNGLLVLSGILTDINGQEAVVDNAHIIIKRLIELVSYPHMMLIRETAIECLVAMSELPHARIYPMRTQVLLAISKALGDRKRVVRQEAVRCRQAWSDLIYLSCSFFLSFVRNFSLYVDLVFILTRIIFFWLSVANKQGFNCIKKSEILKTERRVLPSSAR